MARYVDGFVIPIAKKRLAGYRRMARTGMSFDVERMTYGGFDVIVDLK